MSYLNAGPADVAAFNNLGQSLQQMGIGLAAQRNQAYRDAQRNMIEQLYYGLAKRKQEQEEPLIRARVTEAQTASDMQKQHALEYMANIAAQKQQAERMAAMTRLGSAVRSPAVMQMIQEPGTAGGPNPLIKDLQDAGAFPASSGAPSEIGMDPAQARMLMDPNIVKQILNAARAGTAEGEGIGTPASASKMVEPMIMRPGEVATDPMMGTEIAKGPPAIPHAGAMTFDERMKLEQQKIEAARRLKIFGAMTGFNKYGEPADVGEVERAAGTAFGSQGGEEVRVTKDGRKAVFDSKTKKFLRYAE